MLNITDRTINVFEARIMELITITDITRLPQWTDADVIGAECLMKEYRRNHPDVEHGCANIATCEHIMDICVECADYEEYMAWKQVKMNQLNSEHPCNAKGTPE